MQPDNELGPNDSRELSQIAVWYESLTEGMHERIDAITRRLRAYSDEFDVRNTDHDDPP